MMGLLPIAVSLLALAGPDDPPDRGRELARHQGAWTVERSVRDGKEGPPGAMKEIVRVVEGERVVWKRAGKPFAATAFALDPTTDPPSIDLIPEGGPNRGDRVLGIYTFEGDRLTICTADPGKPRPSAFAAGPGDGATLMTFRRADPEADPDPAPPSP